MRRSYVTLIAVFFGLNVMAANKVMRIMPLGDSITFGSNYPGGYRVHLEELLATKKITAEFVGSEKNGPKNLKSKHNEGHSGWKIQQISDNIEKWLYDSQPDIVLLMIGTNDIWVRQDGWTPDIRVDVLHLSALIDKILIEPHRRVIVASIPLTQKKWNNYVIKYNDAVKDMLVHRSDFGSHVLFADNYSSIKPGDLDPADGVHPSPSGHAHLAESWFQVLNKLP